MSAAMSLNFTQEFFPEYQRNNKRTGQKNLRCFPTHNAETGHDPHGFCGQPVEVVASNVYKKSQVVAWGEFVQADRDTEPEYTIKVGDVIELDWAVERERTRETPFEPWMRGDVSTEGMKNSSVRILFNKMCLGWHYAWMGSKYKSQQEHVYAVYLFVKQPGTNKLSCVSVSASPRFKLYSRRRTGEETCTAKRLRETSSSDLGTKRHCSVVPLGLMSAKDKRMLENQTLDRMWMFSFQPSKTPAALVAQAKALKKNNMQMPSQDVGLPTQNQLEIAIDDMDIPTAGMTQLPWDSSTWENGSTEHHPEHQHHTKGEMGGADFFMEMHRLFVQPESTGTSDGSEAFSTTTEQYGTESFTGLPDRGESSEDEMEGINLLFELLSQVWTEKSQEAIHRVSEAFIKVQSHALDLALEGGVCENMAREFSSDEGVRRLKAQVQSEQKFDFEWSREREFEDFDVQNPNLNMESSIFGRVRNGYRKMLRRAVERMGMTLDMFHEPFDLMARCGFISTDPMYPPEMHIACSIKIALYGLKACSKSFDLEDYGSRRRAFAGPQQQKNYARDLLLMKRAIFRRIVCNRVIEERRSNQLVQQIASFPVVDSSFDLTGDWRRTSAPKDSDAQSFQMLFTMNNGNRINGLTAKWLGRLVSSFFSRVQINMSSTHLVLKGKQVVVGTPPMMFPLDGTVKTLRMPNVVSFGGLVAPVVVDRPVCGWISHREDGAKLVNMVMSKATYHDKFQDLRTLVNSKLKTIDTSVSKDRSVFEKIKDMFVSTISAHTKTGNGSDMYVKVAEFLAAQTAGIKEDEARPVVRTLKQVIIRETASDGKPSSFTEIAKHYLYATEEDAPDMADTEKHEMMAFDPKALEIACFTHQYEKIDSTETSPMMATSFEKELESL